VAYQEFVAKEYSRALTTLWIALEDAAETVMRHWVSGRFPASDVVRLVFMVGICGAYTTLSFVSLQTLVLLRNGAPGRAVINIDLSVFLCILAAATGAPRP